MSETTEQCLLGCLIRDPSIWDKAQFLIKKHHFTLASSIKLFEIFGSWVSDTKPNSNYDSVDFIRYLGSDYKDWLKLNNKNVSKVLSLIVDKEQANEKWEVYRKELDFILLNNKTLDILASAYKRIEENPRRSTEIIRESLIDLTAIEKFINNNGDKFSLEEMFLAKQERLLAKLSPTYTPALSGISSLDAISKGYYNHSYNIIAARSSMGKSVLMGNMVKNQIDEQDKRILVFNTETDNDMFIDRWASNALKLDSTRLADPKLLTKAEFGLLSDFHQEFPKKYENKIFMYDDIYSLEKIFEKIIMHYNEYGIDGVYIDLIGYIASNDKFPSRQTELAYISNELFKFRKRYPIFITVLQQQNKFGDTATPEGNSGQSSMREAEDVYLQADSAILIYPSKNDENKKDMGQRILTVDKNRNGPTGSTSAQFIKEFLLFNDNNLGEELFE